MQKILDSKVMRERLEELRDELVPLSADEKRKKKEKKKTDPAPTEFAVVKADVTSNEPNPYAHWATASADDDDDDDNYNDNDADVGHGAAGGGARLNGDDEDDDDSDDDDDYDGEEEEGYGNDRLAWEDDADADRSVPFEVPEPEDDGSGMFLPSLSAMASGGRAPPRVSRDVFASVDVHAAASTQIGGKKRKNRPGQMARQKKAALKHGEEVSPSNPPDSPTFVRPCSCLSMHQTPPRRTHTLHVGSDETHHTSVLTRSSPPAQACQRVSHLPPFLPRACTGKARARSCEGCDCAARRAAEKEIEEGERERKERARQTKSRAQGGRAAWA